MTVPVAIWRRPGFSGSGRAVLAGLRRRSRIAEVTATRTAIRIAATVTAISMICPGGGRRPANGAVAAPRSGATAEPLADGAAAFGSGPSWTPGPDADGGRMRIQPGSITPGFSSSPPPGCGRPLFSRKIAIAWPPLPSVLAAISNRYSLWPLHDVVLHAARGLR